MIFLSRRYHNIISHIDTNPNRENLNSGSPAPIYSPTQSHSSNRILITVGKKNDPKYLDGEYRYAYHDLTDPNPGFPAGSKLELLSLNVRKYNGYRPIINKISIIDMESLTPANQFYIPRHLAVLHWHEETS